MALDAQGVTNAGTSALPGVAVRTITRMRNGHWSPPAGSSMPLLGRSPLTGVIKDYMEDDGCTLDGLTVLARGNDPFRQDTAEGHRLGRWLRDTLEGELGFAVGEGGRTIHNRGLHYLLLGSVKPDGSVYQNSEREWKWLSDRVSKAARWLGYVRSPRSPTRATPSRILALAAIWICPLAKRNCRRRPHRSRNVTACRAVPLLILPSLCTVGPVLGLVGPGAQIRLI